MVQALTSLRSTGAQLFNQSVLLRGVNDRVDTLVALSEVLFDAGAVPYYLHMLDPVQGAAHFEVTEATARQLMLEMNSRLPGYLMPRLVREFRGAPGKVPMV